MEGTDGTGPIGKRFTVQRSPDVVPCGLSAESPTTRRVDVASANEVLVDGYQDTAAGTVVHPQPADEQRGEPANVEFQFEELWEGVDRNQLRYHSAPIHYQLWIDGSKITGRAQTNFEYPMDGVLVPCEQTWLMIVAGPNPA